MHEMAGEMSRQFVRSFNMISEPVEILFGTQLKNILQKIKYLCKSGFRPIN